MRRIRRHLTYANVMATLAVFIALGGTALASVIITKNSQVAKDTISGHNPPTGDHSNLILKSVNGQDLAPAAVTAGKLAANSINGSKVLDGSLTGADVQDNSLTGSDINSGTLGEVPFAQAAEVGGLGRSNTGNCDPTGSGYLDCAITTVNLPRATKVLLIGRADAGARSDNTAGNCKLVTQFGDVANTSNGYFLENGEVMPGALVGITGSLGPGSVDFGIDCNQTAGDIYYGAGLAAVAISPD